MTDYVKREDVLKLKSEYASYNMDISSKDVEALPSADAVEVVRCKACNFSEHNGVEWKCKLHSGSSHTEFGYDKQHSEFHGGNWFCADGRRRDDATD